MPERQVAGHGARLDHRGTLPILPHAFVIDRRRLHGDGDLRGAGVGAQAQVDAINITVFGCVLEQANELPAEVTVDVSGVPPEAIRILFKSGVLLIVGEKERPDLSRRGPASFHLVERDFGRFARAVRINVAIDGSQARARLVNGELRVMLPRIAERRGAGLMVPIDSTVPR